MEIAWWQKKLVKLKYHDDDCQILKKYLVRVRDFLDSLRLYRLTDRPFRSKGRLLKSARSFSDDNMMDDFKKIIADGAIKTARVG